jgi:hypothetical protein
MDVKIDQIDLNGDNWRYPLYHLYVADKNQKDLGYIAWPKETFFNDVWKKSTIYYKI